MRKRCPPGKEVWIGLYQYTGWEFEEAVFAEEDDCAAWAQSIVRSNAAEFDIPEDTRWDLYSETIDGQEQLYCWSAIVRGAKRIGDHKR